MGACTATGELPVAPAALGSTSDPERSAAITCAAIAFTKLASTSAKTTLQKKSRPLSSPLRDPSRLRVFVFRRHATRSDPAMVNRRNRVNVSGLVTPSPVGVAIV